MLWQEIHVDLIGPWKVNINEHEVEFNTLTCINPITNLMELICIDNKTAAHMTKRFKNSCLAHYIGQQHVVFMTMVANSLVGNFNYFFKGQASRTNLQNCNTHRFPFVMHVHTYGFRCDLHESIHECMTYVCMHVYLI